VCLNIGKCSTSKASHLLFTRRVVIQAGSEVRELVVVVTVAPFTEMIADVETSAQHRHNEQYSGSTKLRQDTCNHNLMRYGSPPKSNQFLLITTFQKLSSKFNNFLCYPANRQTDKQTDRQTDRHRLKHILLDGGYHTTDV